MSVENTWRVGIIGCGAIAQQRHAREYGNNPTVEMVGYHDFDAARAENMAKRYGGRVYVTAEELLADKDVDAVSVCAANKFHAALTIAALNAGKHVLCEKPMAVSLEDCEAMLAAAQKNGRRLLIGHNQRLAPAHKKAKEILDSGGLGRAISFQSTFGHKGPEMWSVDQGADTWFFKKSMASFGSMADLGIHKIDLMRFLLGGRVDSVFSTLATLDKKFPNGAPIEVDDNSVQVLHFAGGALGTVTTSWTYYGEECNATTLYCEGGILKLYHSPLYSLEIVYGNGTKAHYEIDRMQTNEDAQQASSGVIDEFVSAVLAQRASPLDAQDIVESMRVVFACLASARQGKMVAL